jgi:hypothetical protein
MRHVSSFFAKPTLISTFIVLSVIGIAVIIVGVIPNEQAQTANLCSAGKADSPTLIRTYHLLDLTDGFGVTPTKDGGYLVTGDTLPASGMAAPQPFILKTNAKGDLAWTRWFDSESLALGAMSSRRIGRLTVETSDGNFIAANDQLGFVDESKKEMYGDIFVTKFNLKGTMLWSLVLGNHSEDRPRKLWALPDGGVMVLGRFFQTGFGDDVADSEAVPKYSALIRIDKNGKVVFMKKMNWNAEDMERLADGSYIALANIAIPRAEQPDNILGPELVPHPLPTIIRLDKDANVSWAKSMEMIPTEINAPTSYGEGGLTIGKTKIRMAGGDFRAVKQTPDGGFIAFGFDNFALTQGLTGGPLKNMPTVYSPRPLVAVKVDAAGNYVWTKKLTHGLMTAPGTNDFQVVKTSDGQFIIMEDVIRDSAGIQAKSDDAAQKRKALSDACKAIGQDCLDPANLPPEVKPAADEEYAAMKIWSLALASNVGLIKTDADFNPRWIKKYDVERDISGYGIAPTADKGVVVSASMLTTKEHMVMQTMEPYKEAALLKVDANGGVNGCASVSDHPQAAVEDQSPYLIMQNMDVSTGAMTLAINKKVKEKVPTIKDTARSICAYKKTAVTPICSYVTSGPSTGGPSVEPGTPPVARTWASVNYDNATPVAAEGEKNISINDELMSILNQVYANQVKLKDSMKNMWLTYIFPRPATRADVEAVQKYYAGLGYKIDESTDGLLYVSRVGLTLHMTFSINNSNVGKLEVLF